MPAENGTAPTVPVVPTLPAVASQVATSTEGSPREAGTSQAVSQGGTPKQAIGVGLMALGMGLVAMVVG